MFGIFKKHIIYLKVYPGSIEIRNLKNGESLKKSSIKDFSNNRMVVADFGIASNLANSIMKELKITSGSITAIAQQMVVHEEVLHDSEKRVLRDICENIGASTVYIITNDQPMTDQEVLDFLKTA